MQLFTLGDVVYSNLPEVKNMSEEEYWMNKQSALGFQFLLLLDGLNEK
jgi:hypothetical protein